ncbi:type II secretion system F family protein [Patescibacteria group bacterium]|nr:type II secretion system F family protein [Patescibacteria group bacterium]
MPTYTYTAISKQGEYLTGKEVAKDEHELAGRLRKKGYILTNADLKGLKKPGFQLPQVFSGLFGVPLVEKLMFMRSLKVMIVAGIALPKTLEVLSLQTKSKKLKNALIEIRERVLKGQQLSLAMSSYPGIFPDLVVNMIRTGEESGTLENVLSQLTLQLEREHDLRSKIQGALIYPAVIMVAMIGIGILMLITVVPTLAATFEELQIPLPATTRAIIAFADFFISFWYLVIIFAVVGAAAGYQVLRTKTGKNLMDTVILRVPIVGPIVKKVNTAFFARTMSSLIGAGIPMVRALEVTATVLGNTHFKKVLQEGAEEMRKGVKLSVILSRYPNLYPIVVVQMVEVGEETGQTSELLAKLAEFFEEEVTNITKNMASIIEPILMLIIGAVVGFFAIAMIQPMYSMLGNVQ